MAYLCTKCELDRIEWLQDGSRAGQDRRALILPCEKCSSKTVHLPNSEPQPIRAQ